MMTDIFSKFAMTAFALGGLVLMAGNPGWFPEFYRPRIMGALALLYAFLIALPSLVFRPHADPKDTAFARKLDFRTALQAAIALAVTLDAGGGLGLYRLHRLGFEYDKLSHFAVALCCRPRPERNGGEFPFQLARDVPQKICSRVRCGTAVRRGLMGARRIPPRRLLPHHGIRAGGKGGRAGHLFGCLL